jgi:uncharacterized LabA/DUF88 family protein
MSRSRVAVFVDYQNAYKRIRATFDPDDLEPHPYGQVDPYRLGMKLAGTGRDLVSVQMYRGLPSNKHDPSSAGAADRQVAQWNKQPTVSAVTRPLNYRDPSSPKEKGIDVALAVDFVMMSREEFDIGILVSADTDLLPALEAVLKLKGVGSCEVACWISPGIPPQVLRIPKVAIKVHALYEADYRAIADLTDYNIRTRRR